MEVNTKSPKESDNAQPKGKVKWRKAVTTKKRLVCFSVILVSLSFLFVLNLDSPIERTASGDHVVVIPKPGAYLAFFRGDLKNPYGWQIKDGWIRKSLEVSMKPLESDGKVVKVKNFKDLSQASLFSIAEFEVYKPGKYFLTIEWKNPMHRCDGHVFLERDVVEKFFYKWAAGILSLIAFLAIIGFPIGPE